VDAAADGDHGLVPGDRRICDAVAQEMAHELVDVLSRHLVERRD
jgi:hypothetical protein